MLLQMLIGVQQSDGNSETKYNLKPSFLGDECGEHQFKCVTDEFCIPLEYRCNRRLDCYDGSDEKGCGKFRKELAVFLCRAAFTCLLCKVPLSCQKFKFVFIFCSPHQPIVSNNPTVSHCEPLPRPNGLTDISKDDLQN